MAKEPKTTKTKASVAQFIASIKDESRRKDAKLADKVLREISGEKPAIWGTNIVGYGEYLGPTGTWPRTGFSSRSSGLVIYIMPGFASFGSLLKKLGKHKTGKSCLYIARMSEIDLDVLREIVSKSLVVMKKLYPN